jgi:hypothetical protein
MRINRNLAIGFLVLFALVALANLIVPFFLGFNVYVVSLLMIFLVALFAILYRTNDSLKAKLLKGLILVIPIIFFGFVIYSNFNTASEVNYFYDLGGIQEFKSPVLFPSERVSSLKENVSHRNLTAPMVYFNVPAEYSKGNITIAINIKDNLPRNDSLIIGAKASSYEEYITQVAYTASINRTNVSNWQIVSAEFNTSDLFVEDGEYTFYINAPHLGLSSKKNSYVSIDWINVTEKD